MFHLLWSHEDQVDGDKLSRYLEGSSAFMGGPRDHTWHGFYFGSDLN